METKEHTAFGYILFGSLNTGLRQAGLLEFAVGYQKYEKHERGSGRHNHFAGIM